MQLELYRFRLLSLVIILVLGAQLIASFGHANRFFPFMWYPMYATAHFDGERINVEHRIYAVAPDGSRHYVDPARDLRIDFWRYERRFARPLRDNKLDRITPILRMVVERYPAFTELQVEDYPMIITKNGPQGASRQVIAVIPRSAVEEALK
ncbi:hypothetical protein [Novosphingobium pentaromativorans]|uniref:hypothetical protein n=1 Tax=Novosphingobium pentaromativorans TaxID=205844 RepID=UPI00193A0188|nr:hypothetical protein [Novosphingobium pentaromativorans]